MSLLRVPPIDSLDDIAHVIQLAIAPVFLLTAVGTLLSVLTNRLGRAVDRRRVLERLIETGAAEPGVARATAELAWIARRVGLIYRAITLAVLCALLICLVIATAFVDAFLAINLARLLGAMFIFAMVALIGSLLMFLREIFIAVNTSQHTLR
jgi:Protein of unknown function (DUF2721)